jgi:L-seryl-tRNA(Ser) seleniumtransferase
MDFNVVQSYILKLPDVEELKSVPKVKEMINQYSEEIVEEYLQKIINQRHKKIVSAADVEEIKNFDYSFDFYIEKLKENLIVEKGRPLKKVLNCLGTIYSQYIGDRFYSKDIIKDFEMIFTGYNNLEFDEERGQREDLDYEIKNLFLQISKGKDFLLLNNISSALYVLIDTLYKGKTVIMSLADTVYLSEKIGLQDVVKRAGGNLKIVGYLNKIEEDDYLQALEGEDNLIVYTDIFENSVSGIKKIDFAKIKKLKNRANVMYLSNKISYQTNSDEIKSIGKSINEVMDIGASVSIFDFSKLAGGPELGIVSGDKEIIEKIKNNAMYKILSPSKEIKTIFYLTLKTYLEKKYNNLYINKCFLQSDQDLKKRNRKFLRNLEREIGEAAKVGFMEGQYFNLDDRLEGYSFNRELVYIKPENEEAEKIEIELRKNKPCVLCWVNEGTLIFNLQLLAEDEEEMLIEILSKKIMKSVDN